MSLARSPLLVLLAKTFLKGKSRGRMGEMEELPTLNWRHFRRMDVAI